MPIRRNDRIDVSVKLLDVAIRHGEFAGRSVKQTSEVLFTNQNGELVARSMPWGGIRTERGMGSMGGSKHKDLSPAEYTSEDIERIAQLYAEEPSKIRGGARRDTGKKSRSAIVSANSSAVRGPQPTRCASCVSTAGSSSRRTAIGMTTWLSTKGRPPQSSRNS